MVVQVDTESFNFFIEAETEGETVATVEVQMVVIPPLELEPELPPLIEAVSTDEKNEQRYDFKVKGEETSELTIEY